VRAGSTRTIRLLRGAGVPGIALACVNDPGECVVSGPLPALRALEELAGRQGVPTTRLRLPFSSHHPALTGPADAFPAALADLAALWSHHDDHPHATPR